MKATNLTHRRGLARRAPAATVPPARRQRRVEARQPPSSDLEYAGAVAIAVALGIVDPPLALAVLSLQALRLVRPGPKRGSLAARIESGLSQLVPLLG